MKFALSFLVTSVGQMCNLRCKNCANFAPYAPKEFRRYPIENIVADFESLFKAVGRIDVLQIQGGEPLIYSDLPKLMSYLRACKEVQEIFVATNGTIIPDDDCWKNFAANNIKLRVSNYLQNRSKLETFAAKAQAFGIDWQLYDFATHEDLWYDCGGMDTPRTEDDSIVAARFDRCRFSICLTLENGELHRCSRAVHAANFQHFDNLPTDFVQVRGNENLQRDLLEYFYQPKFETACRYCNGTAGAKKIPAAEQI